MILLQVVFASFLISLVSLVGAYILINKRILESNVSHYLVSFAAGTMLAVSFFDLLPESIRDYQGTANIFVPVMLGILLFFFLERFILWFHHHDSPHETKPTVPLILVGDGVHNFIDGLAIAATFMANPAVGIVTSIAIAAHEIPQEIGDLSVLIDGGLRKSKALFFNLLSGLTSVLGAVGGYYFLAKLEGTVPILLAFTAGMFIYIACSDLIPEMHMEFKKIKGWAQSLPFICGIVIVYLLVNFLGR